MIMVILLPMLIGIMKKRIRMRGTMLMYGIINLIVFFLHWLEEPKREPRNVYSYIVETTQDPRTGVNPLQS
jgi:hypothetical protein